MKYVWLKNFIFSLNPTINEFIVIKLFCHKHIIFPWCLLTLQKYSTLNRLNILFEIQLFVSIDWWPYWLRSIQPYASPLRISPWKPPNYITLPNGTTDTFTWSSLLREQLCYVLFTECSVFCYSIIYFELLAQSADPASCRTPQVRIRSLPD